jgi:hypothetical protein
MSNVSVLGFAKFLGAKTCGGMAQAVGVHWPPPPAVSLREVIRLAGLPLAPVDLGLQTSNGQGPITDINTAPVTLDLWWRDPGVDTPRFANSYELTLTNLETGELWGGRPFTGSPWVTVGAFPNLLQLYAHYEWTVLGINSWGRGPASSARFNATQPAPPQAPSAPPPPPVSTTKTGKLTLTIDSENNQQFGIQGVVWMVWKQTGGGFGPVQNAFGLSGSVTLSGEGQYLISAQVSVTRAATLTSEVAEFIGTVASPASGVSAIVYVWNGGDVTKRFRVMTQDDGGGLYHAIVTLVS